MTSGTSVRLDVAFSSAGDECRGWLFMPDAESSALVILGHGLGATREFGLEPYARRFTDAGIAALAFTYRHFGDSGGQPRQLLDIERQLADWAAAIAYARRLDGIDRQRVALWGTSFGGGHVIEAAARDGSVAAPAAALRYAAIAPRGEVKRYPVGHFDIYRGEPFEQAVRDQTQFLVRNLEVANTAALTPSLNERPTA